MAKASDEAILITGGTGLIGGHVARKALAHGLRPVLFDRDPVIANIADIADRVTLVRGDVGNLADLLDATQRHGVTRMVHLAAVLTIQAAARPAAAVTANCLGTANVFHVARIFDLHRVVYASTAAVYAPRPFYEQLLDRHRVDENDPPMPYDLYGSTKLMCEGLAAQAVRDGQDVVGLRPVMTFGVGRLNGAVGILNRAMRDATLTGRGIVTRPWSPGTAINPMYAKDCADIFLRAALAPKRFTRPVYNLGTGEYLSIQQMMDLVLEALPKGAVIEFEDVVADEGGGIPIPGFDYADLDSSALREELGWTPGYDYGSAVAECVGIYRSEV